MSILVDQNTRLLVQGFTGKEGTFHAQQAIAYGTKVVGGVTPGKGGTTPPRPARFQHRRRGREGDRRQCLRDLRAAALRRRRHHGSRRRRPARWSSASPKAFRRSTWCARGQFLKAARHALIGPNCPGIISPGKCKIGIMPGHIHQRRPRRRGLPLRHPDLRSRGPVDAAWASANPPASASAATPSSAPISSMRSRSSTRTRTPHAIVMIGEIGGNAEETAAAYVKAQREEAGGRLHRRPDRASRPPHGPRRRHHLRRLRQGRDKIKAMEEAGITVCSSPAEIGEKIKSRL